MSPVIELSLFFADVLVGIIQLVMVVAYWLGRVRCTTLVNWSIWAPIAMGLIKVIYSWSVGKTLVDMAVKGEAIEEDDE